MSGSRSSNSPYGYITDERTTNSRRHLRHRPRPRPGPRPDWATSGQDSSQGSRVYQAYQAPQHTQAHPTPQTHSEPQAYQGYQAYQGDQPDQVYQVHQPYPDYDPYQGHQPYQGLPAYPGYQTFNEYMPADQLITQEPIFQDYEAFLGAQASQDPQASQAPRAPPTPEYKVPLTSREYHEQDEEAGAEAFEDKQLRFHRFTREERQWLSQILEEDSEAKLSWRTIADEFNARFEKTIRDPARDEPRPKRSLRAIQQFCQAGELKPAYEVREMNQQEMIHRHT